MVDVNPDINELIEVERSLTVAHSRLPSKAIASLLMVLLSLSIPYAPRLALQANIASVQHMRPRESSVGIALAGNPWQQQTEFNGLPGASWGDSTAVSSDGNTLAIGAQYALNNAGAVYVFTRNGSTWTQQAVLTATTDTTNAYFGASLAMSGNGSYVVVGAYALNNNTGAAYVFARSGTVWSQQAVLTATDGMPLDQFAQGNGLAISNDGATVIVGAYQGADQGVGHAYVFTRSGTSWSQTAELTAPDAQNGDGFGTVAISPDGNTAVIGALYQHNVVGAAYIFVRTGATWAFAQELTPSTTACDFGDAVATSSSSTRGITNTIVVGADGADCPNTAGKAYVFVQNMATSTWKQTTVLVDPASAPPGGSNHYGSTVAINASATTILVGASSTNNTGAAYAYVRRRPSWFPHPPVDLLTAADTTTGDAYGQSVSVSGNGKTALVSATGKDSGAGAAYVFVR